MYFETNEHKHRLNININRNLATFRGKIKTELDKKFKKFFYKEKIK